MDLQCIRRKQRCFPFSTELGASGHASKRECPPSCVRKKNQYPRPHLLQGERREAHMTVDNADKHSLGKKKKVLFAFWYVPQKFNGSFDLNFTTLNE